MRSVPIDAAKEKKQNRALNSSNYVRCGAQLVVPAFAQTPISEYLATITACKTGIVKTQFQTEFRYS
jgi:hypothetical protein